MKRFLIFVLAAVFAASPAFATDFSGKKRLTDAQILGELPEGIFNEIKYKAPVPPAQKPVPQLVEGWVNPTWSPDGSKIAYTRDNDLYSIDINTKEIVRHTYDGSQLILNGYASWVYYEEIFGRPSRYCAFWWSPDSKVLAFYRFDNSNVPMFPIYLPDGKRGILNETRYPKTGESNPKVKIGFVSAAGGETLWADFDSEKDQYFGTPFWNGDGTRLMVSWMDRAQDNLELFSVSPVDGTKVSIYKESQKSWIDWMDEMLFGRNGIYIVRDFTQWQQIYYLSYDGNTFTQLTGGNNWAVHLKKLSPGEKELIFTARRDCDAREDIYRLDIKKQKIDRLSYGDLNFSVKEISDDCTSLVAEASNGRTPTQIVRIAVPRRGAVKPEKDVTVMEDSKGPEFDEYAIAPRQLTSITTRDGLVIPALVTWPVDLDTNAVKKYPVKVNIYGGPDNPSVKDTWNNKVFGSQWWANHGVIQVVLDPRSAGHSGKKDIEAVYRYLNCLEIQDFIDGLKCFTSLPFVNPDKVGVEGFSFGGTNTTLLVTEGNEYFKYGIAGGGVYDWALYDTHYGERYMDRPQDNPEGYAASRVIDRIGNYKGDRTNMLRLTHGTGDDNVHFQNTLQLINQLQKDHKNFELMIYPGGMHGYRGDQKVQSDLQDYTFWYRYLLDSELPECLGEYFR